MDAKKVMVAAVVGLVLYYAITQPNEVAAAVNGLLGWIRDGVATILGWVGLGGGR